jgi:intein/homing endonuclease
VSGTKISMSDITYKNVEDVKIGDVVLSYNFSTSKVEPQKVKGIGSKMVNKIVRYTFDDDSILESTLDHPLYSSQNGWVSMDSDFTMEVYGLQTKDAEVGMTIFRQDGTNPTITSIEIITEPTIVYNVKTVENNHNFFANNLLVHNRCFTYDSPVKMWDGSTKKIGDIVLGDYVLSYKNGEYVRGKVTDKLIHPTNSIVEVAKYKNMVSDRLHPFYDRGEWKPIYDAPEMNFDIQYIDNFYNLEIDGDVIFESEHNFVVENFIVSGLGDNVILNNTFKRQSIFHTV